MYYGLVTIAVVLFGINFLCDQKYQNECGSGTASTLAFMLGGSLLGLPVTLALNGFKFEFTWFTLLMALWGTANGMLCTFCSLRALGRTNLSHYSLFSMLGGMVLPFCAGVLFFDEALTWPKGLCLVIVTLAMLLTINKEGPKGGMIYQMGIFVFNGMSGVISKVFQASEFAKTSAAAYSMWGALLGVVVAGTALLFVNKKDLRFTLRGAGWMAGSSTLNRIGNLLLLVALVHIPASVQYPMVTGGVMVVSTLLSYFTPHKPTKRQLLAVGLAFVGVLLLVL